MSNRTFNISCLASIALMASFSTVTAAPPKAGHAAARPLPQANTSAPTSATPTAKQQQRLGRELTAKWATYVQRIYGVEAEVWAGRMAPDLAQADATNLRHALARDTFEGAMAELAGSGAKLSDDQAIDALAAAGSGPTPMALGALTEDLVYTPVAPCRILDTRNIGDGAIPADTTINFVAISSSSFVTQGGSATDCGTPGLRAAAVAINLTAVAPSAAGFATAFPYGTARPFASSLNYTAGAIVNNALIVQIPNPLAANDVNLYTFAQSHYVADIVGYFAPPRATALECQDTAVVTTPSPGVVPGGTRNEYAPSCPAGFTGTHTNCVASSWLMPIVAIAGGGCSARNNDAVNQSLSVSRTCCRVPGR